MTEINVCRVLEDVKLRRSAASMTSFCGRLILFGGVPFEEDKKMSETPEALRDLLGEFGLTKQHEKMERELAQKEEKEEKGNNAKIQNVRRNFAADNSTQQGNLRRKNKNSSTTTAAAAAEDQEEEDFDYDDDDDEDHLASMELFISRQLHKTNGNFPSIVTRSPIFVFCSDFVWRFIPTEFSPFSRHGCFILKDPFCKTSFRIMGGEIWSLNEPPPADLVFELILPANPSSSSSSYPERFSAKFSEGSIPGLPCLYSPAVCDFQDHPKQARDHEEDEREEEKSEVRAVAFVFGGMMVNRNLSDSLFLISATKAKNSSISSSSSSSSSSWTCQRISPTTGSKPRRTFKGQITHAGGNSLFVFDGFDGNAKITPKVSQLNLQTRVWRHICSSIPVVRAVSLQIVPNRFLLFVGGMKYTKAASTERVSAFALFDLKEQAWIGGESAAVNYGENSKLQASPLLLSSSRGRPEKQEGEEEHIKAHFARSAHCGCGIVVNSKELKYLLDDEHDDDDDGEVFPSSLSSSYRFVLFGGSRERFSRQDAKNKSEEEHQPQQQDGGKSLGSLLACEVKNISSSSLFNASAAFLGRTAHHFSSSTTTKQKELIKDELLDELF